MQSKNTAVVAATAEAAITATIAAAAVATRENKATMFKLQIDFTKVSSTGRVSS